MKIKSFQFHTVSPQFKHQIRTRKVEMTHRKTLILEVITTDDKVYYGECNAFETDWYLNETIEDVRSKLTEWLNKNQHLTFDSFQDVQQALVSLEAFPAARATLVMALYQAFHEMPTFKVPFGATVSGNLEEHVSTIKKLKSQRLKLKWHDDIQDDLTLLDHHHIHCPIILDANQTLSISNFHTIDRINREILYIEEPFKHLDDLNHISKDYNIAIDEHASSYKDIMNYLKYPQVNTVIIKPFRVGGNDIALELIQTLQQKGVQVVVGGMYELGLSRYFTAFLASHTKYPGDITPAGYYFKEDIVHESGVLSNGNIQFQPPKVDARTLNDEV
ncbi:o-succinylbenzoate synthase [Staphylococcus massiliensis CCUG 55927]|uniref:o-succinylbenzoate synthase n=1 Tax=Staphylococcus massiliensis TaxID=555791 RepID=UPI00031EDCED|nr:o-succinylbenzoate synthase [Staphylococcus massiliensis]PNZ99052.1 o-succinylbenzoate synthase [Staphylococcus massiliensis CCUG 55927]